MIAFFTRLVRALHRFPPTKRVAYLPYDLARFLLGNWISRNPLAGHLYLQQRQGQALIPGYSDLDFLAVTEKFEVKDQLPLLRRLCTDLRGLKRFLPLLDLNSFAIVDRRWQSTGSVHHALYLPSYFPPSDWRALRGPSLGAWPEESASEPWRHPDVAALFSKQFLKTFDPSLEAAAAIRLLHKLAGKASVILGLPLPFEGDAVGFFHRLTKALAVRAGETATSSPVSYTDAEEKDLYQSLRGDFGETVMVRVLDPHVDIWFDPQADHLGARIGKTFQVSRRLQPQRIRWHFLPFPLQQYLWRNGVHYDLRMLARLLGGLEEIEPGLLVESARRVIVGDQARACFRDLLHQDSRQLDYHISRLEFAAQVAQVCPSGLASGRERWEWRQAVHREAMAPS